MLCFVLFCFVMVLQLYKLHCRLSLNQVEGRKTTNMNLLFYIVCLVCVGAAGGGEWLPVVLDQ